MEVRTAYCSACDRNVRVMVKPEALEEGSDGHDPSDLVCLEYGESCTGDMCPLFDVPTEQMKENLERMLEEKDAKPEDASHG
jgi:hypothetical protein